jgi:hypothetical protein
MVNTFEPFRVTTIIKENKELMKEIRHKVLSKHNLTKEGMNTLPQGVNAATGEIEDDKPKKAKKQIQ